MTDTSFSVLLVSPWTYPTNSTWRLALPTLSQFNSQSSQVKVTWSSSGLVGLGCVYLWNDVRRSCFLCGWRGSSGCRSSHYSLATFRQGTCCADDITRNKCLHCMHITEFQARKVEAPWNPPEEGRSRKERTISWSFSFIFYILGVHFWWQDTCSLSL